MIIKQSSSLKQEETKGKFWKNRVPVFPLTLWVDLVVVTKHLWAPVRILSWQPILASKWEPHSEMCLVLQARPVWRVLQLLASRRSVVSLSSSPFPVSKEGLLEGQNAILSVVSSSQPPPIIFSHSARTEEWRRAGQYFSVLKAFDYSWLISLVLKRN